jgi:large subunit ribosomal protein L13
MKNNTQTKATRIKDIQRTWHLIDVKDKVLGRESTNIAKLLMGKGKPYFTRNLDVGDYVIVVNSKNVRLSGKKEDNKKYYSHSGYPGGLRTRTVKEQRDLNPSEIVYSAVKGMLPQNRLRDKMLRRLKVFPGQEHPYSDKLKGETN